MCMYYSASDYDRTMAIKARKGGRKIFCAFKALELQARTYPEDNAIRLVRVTPYMGVVWKKDINTSGYLMNTRKLRRPENKRLGQFGRGAIHCCQTYSAAVEHLPYVVGSRVVKVYYHVDDLVMMNSTEVAVRRCFSSKKLLLSTIREEKSSRERTGAKKKRVRGPGKR